MLKSRLLRSSAILLSSIPAFYVLHATSLGVRSKEVIQNIVTKRKGDFLGDLPSIAIAPVLYLRFIIGQTGGPAPYHMAVRFDEILSTTGDGSRWEQGRFEWRWKLNGGIPTTRISGSDPINGATRFLDLNQYAANSHYLSYDTGNITAECRYINSSGIASKWVSTENIKITTRGSSACYVDGNRPDDTGNGLTWATAKKTANAGMSVLNTLGNGATMYCRGSISCTSSTILTVENALITKDPSSSQECTINITSNISLVSCDGGGYGVVVANINFTGSAGRILNCEDNKEARNICIYNCKFGGIEDVTSGSGDADIYGLSHICLTETSSILGQTHFSASCLGFMAWNVYAPKGSTGEHNYRFTSGGISGRDNAFHSFQYYTGGCSTTKGSLRWYGRQHLWLHGCKLRRAVYLGSHSPLDNSVGGDTFCFERCHFQRQEGQATDFAINIKSNWQKCTFRSCFFNRITCLFQPRNEEDINDRQDYFEWINCDFYNTSGQSINWEHSTTLNVPLYQKVINCRFRGGNSSTNRYLWFKDTSQMTGYVLQGNIFERTNGQNIARNIATTADLNFTSYQALTGVSNETQVSSMTVDDITQQPDNGLTTGIVTKPRAFVSYYDALRYDPNIGRYPSGSWLSLSESKMTEILPILFGSTKIIIGVSA